jgi:RNA polymerase sigma-70 factor (ECF subfamily)
VGRLADIDIAAEVLSRARGGDPCAQAAIYAGLAPAAFGLIRRLAGGGALAEDLFQDTMMAVFQGLPAFRGEAPVGAWVRRIAVSKCLMYLRSPWHRARVRLRSEIEGIWELHEWRGFGSAQSDAGELSGGSGPEGDADARVPHGANRQTPGTGRSAAEAALLSTPAPDPAWLDVERALATLSPTARAVVWLFEVEGYSHEEIARSFGRSVSFSKSQLTRAHAKLRQWFDPPVDGRSCATPLDL